MHQNKWDSSRYPKSLIEAAVLHSFYMGLGFSENENIFITLQPNAVIVSLRVNGKDFSFGVGRPEFPLSDMEKLWFELLKDWNKGGPVTDEDVEELWLKSRIREIKEIIMRELLRRGMPYELDKLSQKWN
jgi:hypothetical protein